ncbi:cytochrome c oxidase caa3 assembly factor [Candidatus Nanopelagicus hibericus]|uniref:Cytochrome c oxidase caa3 assembly factor n=2 Tax=Candidatus Nanopelagicus hibericus TaxID=1884915 RepID=A0A249KAG4_9ACTN|nr:cytochrome c oxidase caa3 assembly factor [Candidatus Nanopelagicus hibericus]
MQLTGVLSIGFLLTLSFLDLDIKAAITNKPLVKKTRLFLMSWLLSIAIYILVQISYLLEQPLSASFDLTVIRSYLTQTSLGKSYLIQIVAVLIVLIIPLKKLLGSYLSLLIALIAITSPVFQSHGSSSGRHGLAIGALVIHVIALSFWVGGLFGLTQLSKQQKLIALPRFSEIALWSAITVAISGAATAWTRLDSLQAWQSKYGVITLVKISLTFTLIGFGALHRRWIIKSDYPSVFRLITAEIGIMFATVFVGSWLSTVNPPERDITSTPALLVTGIEMPAPPTFSRVLLGYEADGLMLGLLIFLVALYIKGVIILTKRGDKWPVGRTIAFALGISAVVFATSGGLGLYSHFAFSNHMMAHMVLGMIAPIGIVLGAPITLALRTLPLGRNQQESGIRGVFIELLHSKLSKFYTNPVVALAIFDGSLFALYFTPLFGKLMQGHSGHFFMSLHFLLAGFLFFQVLIGIDPLPRKVPHIAKIVVIFAAMSIHAFFSISVMSATTLLDGGYFELLQRPWATDLLADQKLGGAIGWAMGEVPILLALLATFMQWLKSDKNEAARIDRAADRAAAMGEDDDLARYNRYLAQLNKRDTSE